MVYYIVRTFYEQRAPNFFIFYALFRVPSLITLGTNVELTEYEQKINQKFKKN